MYITLSSKVIVLTPVSYIEFFICTSQALDREDSIIDPISQTGETEIQEPETIYSRSHSMPVGKAVYNSGCMTESSHQYIGSSKTTETSC